MLSGFKYLATIFLTICVGLSFCACSLKQQNIQTSYPVQVTIKSPIAKISGVGFYKQGGDYINLQLFSGGTAVLNYESNNLICINDKCMTRGIFNTNFFLNDHYAGLIDDILAGKPIYKSLNLIQDDESFTQAIQKEGEYDIYYEVNTKNIEFTETKSGVLIKLAKGYQQLSADEDDE